jgi:hypothetical protein
VVERDRDAEEYIYIRTVLPHPDARSIIERMTGSTLELVRSRSRSTSTRSGCEWTYTTDQPARSSLIDPSRQLRLRHQEVAISITTRPRRFTDIDVHKLPIVDDVFLSVGSNKNNAASSRGRAQRRDHDAAWSPASAGASRADRLPGSAGDSESGFDSRTTAGQQTIWDNWAAESGDINLNGAPLP